MIEITDKIHRRNEMLMRTNRNEPNKLLNLFSVSNRFDTFVKWEDDKVTKETVIADDGENYYFDYDKHKSYYAPHSDCTNGC